MSRTPTIRDVATEAGVSIATVSRILNGNTGFSQETKQRVNETIARIGYRRNETAHSLKTKTSRTVAVLIPEMTSFYTTMLEGIESEARARGLTLAICHVGKGGRESARYEGIISTGAVCGAIVLSLPPECGVDHLLIKSAIPCVFLNSMSKLYDLPFICIDHFQGMYEATRFLVRMGHRRIAIVTGEIEDDMTTTPRLNGYRWALRDSGIEPDLALQVNGSFEYEGALSAFRVLLKSRRDFSAVVTCSDEGALAVIHEAIHAGLRVPEDLSVVGFDNSRTAQIVTPSLTSVSIPYAQMIREAFDNLCAQIAGQGSTGNSLIPLTLAVRESTCELQRPE